MNTLVGFRIWVTGRMPLWLRFALTVALVTVTGKALVALGMGGLWLDILEIWILLAVTIVLSVALGVKPVAVVGTWLFLVMGGPFLTWMDHRFVTGNWIAFVIALVVASKLLFLAVAALLMYLSGDNEWWKERE